MRRWYVTLDDFLQVYCGVELFPENQAGVIHTGSNLLHDAVSGAYALDPFTQELYGNEPFYKADSNILFTKYIYPSCKDLYVGWYDEALSDAEGLNVLNTKFFNKFITILNNTFERYKYLLDTYAAEKANLLGKVKSISVTKYDDTPQTSGGTYDDSYSSTVTTNENGTELNTLMARIAEIDDDMRNLYRDWAREFGGLRIYE